jgi:hypothetical protein
VPTAVAAPLRPPPRATTLIFLGGQQGRTGKGEAHPMRVDGSSVWGYREVLSKSIV